MKPETTWSTRRWAGKLHASACRIYACSSTSGTSGKHVTDITCCKPAGRRALCRLCGPPRGRGSAARRSSRIPGAGSSIPALRAHVSAGAARHCVCCYPRGAGAAEVNPGQHAGQLGNSKCIQWHAGKYTVYTWTGQPCSFSSGYHYQACAWAAASFGACSCRGLCWQQRRLDRQQQTPQRLAGSFKPPESGGAAGTRMQ